MTSTRAFLLGLLLFVPRASALVITLEPEEMAPGASGTATGAPAEPKAPPVPPSGDVKVKATALKSEVALGERFVVEVQATAPPGTTFAFPAEIVTEGAELRSLARTAGSGAPAPPEAPGLHRYEATLFALGEAKVPPVAVKFKTSDGTRGEAATEPLDVRITSRLAKDADPQKIADIRPPVALAVGPAFWIAVALLVVVLLALVVWLIRRRRPAAPEAAVRPITSPADEAHAALMALVASGLLARGDHRGFYIALTALAKRYLERRLAAPVLEMTTAEMVAFLRDAPLARDLVTPMRDLAGAADQIKFARGAGLHAEAERHLEAVRAMIRTLEAAFAPAPRAAEHEKVA